ncbi:hypothetical protein B0T18DRAFT_314652 [Schizothecium vesticola]|uniref:Uncharacterized protein n=1 Tax=Schizothecium vesticola TaxID=314040 RepID=A0AA40F8J0_9PEZI|nr:hypothetical protein B0T18DRAFT_314652 [Schizothecium vesticola]
MDVTNIFPDDMPAIAEKLRTRAQADHRARIPIDRLDDAHRDVLIRAINNVLATDEAILTYAQIIDGLPIADVAGDRRVTGIYGDHPIDDHEELCPGALDKAREVSPQWDPATLAFSPRVVNAFQRAAPGTKKFNTRLIEMVAVALHQFGVLLHQLGFRMHRGDIECVTNWTAPKPSVAEDDWEPIPPPPTLFYNAFYGDWEIYPEGVADMIGYWAECRILGGVVLFDRRAELDADGDLTAEPPNIYLHPSRCKVTFRVTQLLDWQQQALVDFLLSKPDLTAASGDASPVPCPVPVIVDDRNRTRVSPEDALVLRGIYRDVWERKPLDSFGYRGIIRRPQAQVDYPEIGVEALVFNRAAGVPIPKGKMKDYLDGVETLPEGPKKRMLDEYKEYLDREKRAKLDVPEQDENEAEDEPEEGEEGEEGVKEGEGGVKEEGKEWKEDNGEREEGKGKGKEPKGKGKKAKNRVLIVPDTLESLQDFMFSKNKSAEE